MNRRRRRVLEMEDKSHDKMNIDPTLANLRGNTANSLLMLFQRRKMYYVLLPAVLLLGIMRAAKNRTTKHPQVYRGLSWINERTISVKTLGETKFARCDLHTVRSEDGQSVFDDWLFLEEVNAVNVVVQTVEGKFVVFEQQKYAIPGKTLSPVGGFIDAGESPLTSAKREVLEELGLGSKATLSKGLQMVAPGVGVNDLTVEQMKNVIMQTAHPDEVESFPTSNPSKEIRLSTGNIPKMENDPDWIFLGRYRTAANRGAGFLYSYLLKNAVPLVPDGGTAQYVSEGDDESQSISFLSDDQMMEMISNGRFQEIKWAGTFALSLLHLRDGMPGCCIGQQSAGLCFGENCKS
ncbi:hypothetical protein HJC23_002775 [Cyclotella cryptica]|uniref:Nudix hydrolase domain-containing protein n=1 Tax=Cyclotella cryptica TaxID=29204 RepID=A0ABD3PG44_9STRA|eukprot:CCRYP_015021-RA/>CCRYP_015021-RA protein AED:0.05 eAED:0.05 QI:148/1/1/1/0.66/1/4/459/349